MKVLRTNDFSQVATIPVGALPHGLWPSGDGTAIYVGLENGDAVTAVDMLTNKVIGTTAIGQSHLADDEYDEQTANRVVGSPERTFAEPRADRWFGAIGLPASTAQSVCWPRSDAEEMRIAFVSLLTPRHPPGN